MKQDHCSYYVISTITIIKIADMTQNLSQIYPRPHPSLTPAQQPLSQRAHGTNNQLAQSNLNRPWPLDMSNSNNAANYYTPNNALDNNNLKNNNPFNKQVNPANTQNASNPVNPIIHSNPNPSSNQIHKMQSPQQRVAILSKPAPKPQNAFNSPLPNAFQPSQNNSLPSATNNNMQLQSNNFNQVQFNNINNPPILNQPNPSLPQNNPPSIPVVQQNTNSFSPQKRPPPQELSPFDEFLSFVEGQLITLYNQKQDLRPHIEAQLKKYLNFHLRTSFNNIDIKGGQLQQVNKLLSGLNNYFEGRNSVRTITLEQLSYLRSVWNILEDIKKVYQGAEYLRSQQNNLQQATKQLIQKSEQKQETIMYKMGQLHKSFQQEATLPVQFSLGRYDPTVREQQNLTAKWIMLRQQCLRLKELEQRERMEREDHLYDCIRSYQEPPQIDDYMSYRRRKKDNPEIVIIVRQHKEYTPKSSKYRSTKTQQSYTTPNHTHQLQRTTKKSPQISQLYANTPVSHQPSTFTFKLSIVWVDDHHPDELYKSFEGSFQLKQPLTKSEVQAYLTKVISRYHIKTIRLNAQFKFSEIRKKNNALDVSVKIRQKKLVPPQGYTCHATFPSQDNIGIKLTALCISNSHGKIEWKGSIDISELDLEKGQLQIGESMVQCSSQCLNLPCKITFFSLPAKVQSLETHSTHKQIEEKLRKHIRSFTETELEQIDWGKRQYCVTAKCFFQPESESESEKRSEHDDNFSMREVTVIK